MADKQRIRIKDGRIKKGSQDEEDTKKTIQERAMKYVKEAKGSMVIVTVNYDRKGNPASTTTHLLVMEDMTGLVLLARGLKDATRHMRECLDQALNEIVPAKKEG